MSHPRILMDKQSVCALWYVNMGLFTDWLLDESFLTVKTNYKLSLKQCSIILASSCFCFSNPSPPPIPQQPHRPVKLALRCVSGWLQLINCVVIPCIVGGTVTAMVNQHLNRPICWLAVMIICHGQKAFSWPRVWGPTSLCVSVHICMCSCFCWHL